MKMSQAFIDKMYTAVKTAAISSDDISTPATGQEIIDGLESTEQYKRTTNRANLATTQNVYLYTPHQARIFFSAEQSDNFKLPEPVLVPFMSSAHNSSRLSFTVRGFIYSLYTAYDDLLYLDVKLTPDLSEVLQKLNEENRENHNLFYLEMKKCSTLKKAITAYPSLNDLKCVQEALDHEKGLRAAAAERRKTNPENYTPSKRISLETQDAIAKARLLSIL